LKQGLSVVGSWTLVVYEHIGRYFLVTLCLILTYTASFRIELVWNTNIWFSKWILL